MKSFFVALAAAFSAVYLLNPTMGAVELIPDIVPVLGNLDEATAMAILVACMRYFGYDISGFFGKRKIDVRAGGLKSARGRVVDAD